MNDLALINERVNGRNLQETVAANTLSFRDLFAPPFWRPYNMLRAGKGREFWFRGGRGSTKSTFVSEYCALDMIYDAILYKMGRIPKSMLSHCCVFRKVGVDLRNSVFPQVQWSLDKLGVAPWFEINNSNLHITFLPTKQQFQFHGLDDELKVKGIKAPFGYYKNTWFEELAQFHGMNEIRSVKQSVQRGSHGFKTFCTYNPPMTQASWVNIEANEPVEGRYVFKSNYLQVPPEWLGEEFLLDAEDLRRRNEILWRHEYLGEVTGTGGTVFPNVVIREITDEEIARFDDLHYGQDWGYTNAFCWVAVAYQRKRKRILIFDEIYKPHLTPSLAAQLVRQKDMHGEPIYADCEDAAAIAQFNNEYGITTYPVKKGPDSRRYGYRWLQGLFEIVIDPRRCPNLAREFQLMEYKQDRRTGQFIEDYPKEADHGIDATRYAMENESMRLGLF